MMSACTYGPIGTVGGMMDHILGGRSVKGSRPSQDKAKIYELHYCYCLACQYVTQVSVVI